MIDLLIRNVRDNDKQTIHDIAVQDGVIVDTGKCLDHPSCQIIEGNGDLISPGFVESHVHLDIALMNDPLKPGRPEPYVSHYALSDSLEKQRRDFSSEDIVNRSVEAINLAVRHGITAIRAQCHVDREIGLRHLEALTKARDLCSHLVTLQIVAFPQQGLTNHPDNYLLFEEALRSGADVMGAAPNLDRGANGDIDFKAHIDMALDLALSANVDLDVHADLGIPHSIMLDELEVVYLAKRVIECNYHNRVAAGHVSALGSAEPDVVQEALALIQDAQLHIVCQPDLYRLGREDIKNVRRGLTRVRELLFSEVNVTYASNNVRDALRPMGNFDLLEEGLILAYGAHMDTVEELNTIMKMSTYNAARMLGLQNYGLEVGCNADLTIFECQSPSEAIIGQAEKRYVIRRGMVVAENQRVSKMCVATKI
jgi:cytosine deaminase